MGSPDDILDLVEESAMNRATCCTSMNRSSSRAHAILLLRVEQMVRPETGENEQVTDEAIDKQSYSSVKIRQGLLTIVDLAGSERVCKSGSEGTRLEEAKRINRSIASLGEFDCVSFSYAC